MKNKAKKVARPSKRAVKRGGKVAVSIETKAKGKTTAKSYNDDDVDDLPQHVGHIRVEGGLTKNLGDYESARIAVAITLPSDPSEEGMRASYSRASDLLEELLEEEFSRVLGDEA